MGTTAQQARAATTVPADARAAAPEPATALRGRTVVLATDESALAHVAARVTASLAVERGARPAVVRIIDPAAAPAPPPLPGIVTAAADLLGSGMQESAVRDMRARLLAEVATAGDWPFHVRVGNPAARIVALADELDAAMIVLGLRTHGRIDRLFHDETALHVCRLARQPVLVVTSAARALPRRIAVAVDFAPPSLPLLRTTLAVAAGDAHVSLVHVRQPTGTWWDAEPGMCAVRRLGIEAAFAELLADPAVAAATAAGASFDTRVLDGAPAAQLVELAAREGLDLVAVAGHWPPRPAHLAAGGVTETLARDGGVSLLVTSVPTRPPSATR